MDEEIKIRPSDVYRYSRSYVHEVLERVRWEVVDFRRPEIGDVYLTTSLTIIRVHYPNDIPTLHQGMRLILERVESYESF